MLNIDDLRLTDEEIADCGFDGNPPNIYALADQQLAKALWGIQEWLEEGAFWAALGPLSVTLEDHLLAAGIQRPEGK